MACQAYKTVGQLIRENARLKSAIRWALGYGNFKKPFRQRDEYAGEGAYWWRKELRRRAGNIGDARRKKAREER
jgi:hypothetical protein